MDLGISIHPWDHHHQSHSHSHHLPMFPLDDTNKGKLQSNKTVILITFKLL